MYFRKYPQNKDDFDNFRNWQLNFLVIKNWKKSWKRSWKVMEFEKLVRVQTLLKTDSFKLKTNLKIHFNWQ